MDDEAAEEEPAKTDLDEEEEEEAGEEDEEGEEGEEESKCAEKHDGDWTEEEKALFPIFLVVGSHAGSAIQVKSPRDPKDKVQLLNITDRHCKMNGLKEKGASKQICLEMKQDLMKMKVMHSQVVYPLKGNDEYIPLLKECAWDLKNNR